MTSTRVPIPTTTNLKERIAALEQRNSTIAAPSSRSVSPAPGAAGSSTSTVQPAGAFRDKIAKFERKGGVPVPRGRFGLGAPPPSSHGPSKQGQLYGNRIPAPARVVSTGSAYSLSSSGGQGFSRAASPTGESVVGDRRSFSMSSMGGSEFGDDMDYTPVGSPTFAFPLESPDSLVSVPYSPEGPSRPVSTVDGEPAIFNRPIARGTSFQKALEIARNAEVAKVEGRESFVTSVAPEEFEGKESVMVSPIPPPTPVVSPVANSSETVIAHEPVAETSIITAAGSLDDKKSEIVEAAQSTHEPPVDAAVNKVEAQVLAEPPAVEPQVQESTTPEPSPVQVDPVPTAVPAPLDIAPLDQAPASIQSSPIEEESISTPIAPTPVTPETIITYEPQPKAAFTTPKFVEVAPLNIRKVSTPPRRPSTEPSHEPIPTTLPALASLVKPEVAAPPPVIVVDEVATVVDVPPAALDVQASAPVAPAEARVEAVTAKTEPVPRISIMLPPPEIIIDVEKKEEEARKSVMVEKPTGSKPTQPSESVDEFNSRKAPLALNPAIMENDESLVSPPLFTHASVQSLTTVLTNYYTGGLAEDGHEKTFRPSTPPPLPTTTVWPLSPEATLAYDAPETPEQPVTVPPARPRVQALDPQSFLSPPATAGFSVAGSSAGSSMGSMSSLGSRPMSMIETSPTHITRAMRMTPATSRGVPVYLPPNSSRPRKSDFVYFPPTPDADQTQFVAEPVEEEEGRRRRDSEPDLPGLVNRQMPTFTAIVHNKIKDVPATATLPRSKRNFAPSTPQVKRVQRTALPEPPLSPGQGELAALLQETMLLEDTLSKGELPAEHVDPAELERREKERLAEIARAEAEAKAKKEAEEEEAHRQRIAYATAQLQAKRDEPTSGKLKHTFLIPLSKAMSVHHRKESSSTSTLNGSVAQPKSAGVPVPPMPTRAETLDVVSSSQAVKSVPRPKTPEVPPVPKMPELPTKSPKSSRFASLRRLGSMSRSSAAHSARHSNSTSSEISSEDSQPVVTPPETHLEFKLNDSSVSEFGHVSNGSTSSFPSLSPKKSISSIGRATSFAEKMWSRSRTKSGASSLSGASDATIDTSPQLPTLVPSSLEIPSLSVNLAPLSELEENKIVQPPRRSTSLKRSVNLPLIPTEPVPPLPTTQVASSAAHGQNLDMSNDSSHLQPLPSGDSNRPSSWMSVSSAGSLGSLPSPFFDKSLFDAFPSVPENMPIKEHPSFPLRRDNSVPVAPKSAAAAANAGASSFDSALLSSAIHLASSQKAAGVPTTPATGVPPRRSGEVAR
ncbi:hypothetical protein CPC08DRAFT_707586 [Agrocybe pediades]|nr:hypothetical protein CPC08DRAFT_707586 [Agrocybe pediades]